MLDYLYIRAWGKMLRHTSERIESEIKKARAEKAPETAIFCRYDGIWACFEDIDNKNSKAQMRNIISELK